MRAVTDMVLLFPEVWSFLSLIILIICLLAGARTLGCVRQSVFLNSGRNTFRDRVPYVDPEESEGAPEPELRDAAGHTVRLRHRQGHKAAGGALSMTGLVTIVTNHYNHAWLYKGFIFLISVTFVNIH